MEIKRFKVKDIAVDAYQRSVSSAHVAKIVREFDERLLGLPVLSVRDNGSCYVVDGQHRIEALRKLGITEVDCQVLREADSQAEAQLFVKVNTTKKGLNGVDKFFALIEAKNESAIQCKALFAKYGWELVRGSTTRVQTRGDLAMRPNAATLAVFNDSPAELEIALNVLIEAFPADADGFRSAQVAKSMVSFNLIGGLTTAIASWIKSGQWSGQLRTTVVDTLSRAQLVEFTNPQIPVELANQSNAKRILGATALAISQRVAARSRRYGWKLTSDKLLSIHSDQIAKSFAVA
jgi:hypothetical protein